MTPTPPTNGKREEKCKGCRYGCGDCMENRKPDSRREDELVTRMKARMITVQLDACQESVVRDLFREILTENTNLQAQNAELVSKAKVAVEAIQRASTELQKPNIAIKDTIWCSGGDITVVEVLERSLAYIRSSPSSK